MKLKPQARQVLALLRRYGRLTQLEALYDGAGFRLSARIKELREAGYGITTERQGSSGYAVYRLTSDPADDVQVDPRPWDLLRGRK